MSRHRQDTTMHTRIASAIALATAAGVLLLAGTASAEAPAKSPATAPGWVSIVKPIPAGLTETTGTWTTYDIGIAAPTISGVAILSCQPSTARSAWWVPTGSLGTVPVPAIRTDLIGWPVELVAVTGTGSGIKVVGRSGCFTNPTDVGTFDTPGGQYDRLTVVQQAYWGTTGTGGGSGGTFGAPVGSKLAILPGAKSSAAPAVAVAAPTTAVTTTAEPTPFDAGVLPDVNINGTALSPTTAPSTAAAVIPLTPAIASDQIASSYNPVQPIGIGTWIAVALALLLAAASARRVARDRAEVTMRRSPSATLGWIFAGPPVVLGFLAVYSLNAAAAVPSILIGIAVAVVGGITIASRLGVSAQVQIRMKDLKTHLLGKTEVIAAVVAGAAGYALAQATWAGAAWGAITALLIAAALPARKALIKDAQLRAGLAARLAGAFGGSENDWLVGGVGWTMSREGGILITPTATQISRMGAGFEDRVHQVFPEYVITEATSTLIRMSPVDIATAAARAHLAGSDGLISHITTASPAEPVHAAPVSTVKTITITPEDLA